ncbi:hypothetical protein AAMO2058_000826900 [Amorphochlora amoebiformis]
MKKWIAIRIERQIEGFLDRIRAGYLTYDKDKYEVNRAKRRRVDRDRRAAEKKEKEEKKKRAQMLMKKAEEESEMERLIEAGKAAKETKEAAIRDRRRRREEEKKKHREAVQNARCALSKIKKDKELPLYKRIEDRYEKRVVLPEIENRKKTLYSIRQKRQPFDLKKVLDHGRKYDKELMKRAKKKSNARKGEMALPSKKYFKGKCYKKAIKSSEMRKAREKEWKIKEMINRKKRYATLLKEVFVPKVDLEKKKQILTNLEAEKKRERFLQKVNKEKKMSESRPWRIKDKEILKKERERLRNKRREIKEREEEEKKRRGQSAPPDYLHLGYKKWARKKKTKRRGSDTTDLDKLEKNVKRMEEETRQKARALRKRPTESQQDELGVAEKESELYIKLAREKVRFLNAMKLEEKR